MIHSGESPATGVDSPQFDVIKESRLDLLKRAPHCPWVKATHVRLHTGRGRGSEEAGSHNGKMEKQRSSFAMSAHLDVFWATVSMAAKYEDITVELGGCF